jgi:hypothetical protein
MDNRVKGSIGSQNGQYKGKNFEDKNKRHGVLKIYFIRLIHLSK